MTDWRKGHCTLGGRHTPGSEWEKECPLRPEKVAARSAKAKKASQSRWRSFRASPKHAPQA